MTGKFRNLSGSQFDRSRWSAAAAPQRYERGHRQARLDYDRHKLVPARITIALDLSELYGPEVDAACDAAEPDVDRWEAGELYPTWQQVELLAALTDFPVHFFFLPIDAERPWTTLDIHLPGPVLSRRVVSWQPGAFTAAPTPIQGTLL